MTENAEQPQNKLIPEVSAPGSTNTFIGYPTSGARYFCSNNSGNYKQCWTLKRMFQDVPKQLQKSIIYSVHLKPGCDFYPFHCLSPHRSPAASSNLQCPVLFYRIKQAAPVGRTVCGRNRALISIWKSSNFLRKD